MTEAIESSTTVQVDPVMVARLREKMGLLTEAEAAAVLGIEEKTLASWRRTKTAPEPTAIGKNVFYTVQAVEDYIDYCSRVSSEVLARRPANRKRRAA